MSKYNRPKATKGRAKGKKNLKRVDGGLQNQYGVLFTEAEKKALESAVNTANRKRARMLKAEAELPRMNAGKPTGDKIATLQLMGRESDFIIQPKTKSLQRFKSKKDFETYLNNVKRVNKRDYVDERVKLYKRNHIQAIHDNLNDPGLEMKIRMMKPSDYMKWVQANEDVAEIHFVYDEQERENKINEIRASLGMSEYDPSRYE